MTKILYFNFDGTGNEPSSAEQDRNFKMDIEDSNISNILKFHLLLGGNPKNGETILRNGGATFYYRGVGTYGRPGERLLNTLFGPEEHDIYDILYMAIEDFKRTYTEEIEKIVVSGFSRGAALARKFVSLIGETIERNNIVLCVFDTVARVAGDTDEKGEYDPSLDIKFNDYSLSSKVKKALHILSLDERRRTFKPTLINKDPRLLEIWFSGGHSDIGGGYRQSGISDYTLSFLINWLKRVVPNIEIYHPIDIDYKNLIYDKGCSVKIDIKNISLAPDPLDIAHQSKLPPTFEDRMCHVVVDDKISNIERPLLHYSVRERISGILDYYPSNLKGLTHNIYYDDLHIDKFNGVDVHKGSLRKDATILTIDNPTIRFWVYARKLNNHSGVYLQKGQQYEIKVLGEGTWVDGGITNSEVRSGKGWDRASVNEGINEIGYWFQESKRRVRDGRWFVLCGNIGEVESSNFIIGNICTYRAEIFGELCLFANDVVTSYENNEGKLLVKVTLIEN